MIHTPSHTMSPPPSPKKMIPQSSHRMKVNSNMDMETDNEIITLSKSKYPELVNAAVGSTVRGNWEGIVKSIEGDTAQVELMTQEIESENGADREYKRMSNQTGSQENTGNESDEDY